MLTTFGEMKLYQNRYQRKKNFRILTNFQEGDELARQILIEHNLRLVVYIAKKFESSGVNLEDLISNRNVRFNQRGTNLLKWIRTLNWQLMLQDV